MVAFIGKQNSDETVTFPDSEVRRMYAEIERLQLGDVAAKAVHQSATFALGAAARKGDGEARDIWFRVIDALERAWPALRKD